MHRSVSSSILMPALGGLALAVALLGAGPARAADPFASAYISEFMTDGQRVLKDENGKHSGWIEIHNGGRAPVSLRGWHLADSPTNLAKWTFPAITLLPDSYLVVFASGKGATNDPAHLHANFRLDRRGGYLALVNAATNVVFAFAPTYPWQTTNASYGRVRGDGENYEHFALPTPGKPNAAQGEGFSPAVAFSRPGGSFVAPFELKLACADPAAVIRYTLDGSLPTRAAPAYAAPLAITNTAHVRARAYAPRRKPGPPRSAAFLMLHTNALSFTSTLPVLVMETFGQETPIGERSRFVHLSLFEPVKGVTTLTNAATFAARASFHERGSSSRGVPQPSWAVEFMDEFNENAKLPLLGLPADSDWVLYAPNQFEPVLVHNPFAHQLSRDIGRYSPRTRFVEAFLARHPGPVTARDYFGIYVLEEKIRIGKNRVDIDRLGPGDLAPPAVTGGYVVKADRLGPGESGFHGAGVELAYVEPREAVITLPQRAPQRQYLQQYFDAFNRALYGPKWLDPDAGYRAFIDVDSWIDYHVLEVLTGNVDALALSTHLHKPRGGKLVFGPHWDFDRALGSTDGRDDNPRHWNTGPYFNVGWWPRVCSDVDFWQLWVDRWQALRQTHFASANLNGLIDDLTDEVREAQPRHVARWGVRPRGGSYQAEINIMKEWLSNRVDFIDHQLTPRPELGHAGGKVAAGFQLALTGPANAAIYYTLDGTDPRRPQGAVATNAIKYAGPIAVTGSLHVIARAHNPKQRQTGGPPASTPWSGPVAARFTVAKP